MIAENEIVNIHAFSLLLQYTFILCAHTAKNEKRKFREQRKKPIEPEK